MIRIKALNEDESSNDSVSDDPTSVQRKPTKEVQEAEALDLYNSSLELISNSQLSEAAISLEKLLTLPYLNEVDDKKPSPMQAQLKLGCLKNLGSIYYSLKPDPKAAVRVFLLATKLDSNNINLWYRLGVASMRVMDYELAYSSFAQGLRCNPSHWGCLENVVTLAYVLNDAESCLKFCAHGLSKDSKFIRGLVFRDHIFQLQPYLKETLKSSIPDWNLLNIKQEYSAEWKEKYLDEARKLLSSQYIANKRLRDEEEEERSKVAVCSHGLKAYTFTELCRVVLLFYEEIRALGSFLRPIVLTGDFVENELDSSESYVLPMEEDSLKTEDSSSNPNRSSIDEKEVGNSNNASGNEAPTENNCDESGELISEDVNGADPKDKETEEESESPRERERTRKSKRDVKWWQLEGKRRSQRVRGNLVQENPLIKKKESGFAERLGALIPISILSVEYANGEEADKSNAEETSETTVLQAQLYFGTEEEVLQVKQFLSEYGRTNIMEVVLGLVQTLSSISDRPWPRELAMEYLKLFPLYRAHVSMPDPFSTDEYVQEKKKSDSLIALTMLELLLDNASSESIQKLSNNSDFMTQLTQVKLVSKSLEDGNLLVRLHWLLAKYSLASARVDEKYYDNALEYLAEVKQNFELYFNAGDIIRIPASADNCISLEELKNKGLFVTRMKNVTRIHELYESKSYEELVEILVTCWQSRDTEAWDITNKFYLADSLFHLKKYSHCLEECAKIIIYKGKIATPEWILVRCVFLLEMICNEGDFDLSTRDVRRVSNCLISLLVSYEQKEFESVSPTLLTTPWCILYGLLHKSEVQNAVLYLEEETTPNSILLLQFAHQFLCRDGNCCLGDGKLLIFTLNALLPLVSSEEYSEFEALTHCIEQAICCLYSHPSKISKVKYLTDHSCPGIPLEWSHCQQLYEYFKPTQLPEFDTYDSINAETEALFQRILSIIPPELMPIAAYEEVKSFLGGKTSQITNSCTTFPSYLVDIYYLIGDYYFKTKEWSKAIENYTWDLALVPFRFNSWATISLSKAEKLNYQLRFCENFNSLDIITEASVVLACFRKTLDLEPSNSKLRIEFGSFVYSMHSFCSRLENSETETLNLSLFNFVSSRKDVFLAAAVKCFEPTVQSCSNDSEKPGNDGAQDDVWINHYMLGKVMEKLVPNDPQRFLDQYELAGKLLHERGAMYPAKINYYSPQELSIEALEMYYRIHASILKYVAKHEHSQEMEEFLLGFVQRANESPFMMAKRKRQEQAAEVKRRKPNEKDLLEIKSILDDLVSKVDVMEKEEVNGPVISSSSSSSGPSSSIDSSDSCSSDSVIIEDPAKPISFGLSSFCEKLKEKELREGKLAEEAAAAAKVAEQKAAEAKLIADQPKHPAIELNIHFKDVNYGRVISQCLKAMEECVSRFSTHHKSYYRIAYIYFTFCKSHLKISKEWLLGSETDKKRISGLFGDRKLTNFFNGIWRNPVEDIDRPGSFPYHMAKTVQLLIDVLSELNDVEMLTEIGINLSKIPDNDKKCLYDSERQQLSQHAMAKAVATAKRMLSGEKKATDEVGLSIFSSYVKLQKSSSFGKENPMANLLVLAYTTFIKSKGLELESETATVEHAFKYFQHVSWSRTINGAKKGSYNKSQSAPQQLVPQDQPSHSASSQNGISGRHPTASKHVQRKVHLHRRQIPTANPAATTVPPRYHEISAFKPKPSTHSTVPSNVISQSSDFQVPIITSVTGSAFPQQPSTVNSSKKQKPPAPAASTSTNNINAAPIMSQYTGHELLQNYIRTYQSCLQSQGILQAKTNTSTSASTSRPKASTASTAGSSKNDFLLPDLIPNAAWMNFDLPQLPKKGMNSASKRNSASKPALVSKTPPESNFMKVFRQSQFFQNQMTRGTSSHSSQKPATSIARDYGNSWSELLTSPNNNPLASSRKNPVSLPQVYQAPTFTTSLMNSVGTDANHNYGSKGNPTNITPGARPSLFKPSSDTFGQRSTYFSSIPPETPKASQRNPGVVEKRPRPRPKLKPISPSLLRETTPPPSLPPNPRCRLNTSPFKAHSSIFVSPGLSTTYLNPELEMTRLDTNPPAAHSANRTSPYSSSGSPEIIDLTTNRSPIAQREGHTSIMHPETSKYDRAGKIVKQPFAPSSTNQPRSRGPPEGIQTLPAASKGPGMGVRSQCPLPPKKKLMMRPNPIVTIQSIPVDPPEVITLE